MPKGGAIESEVEGDVDALFKGLTDGKTEGDDDKILSNGRLEELVMREEEKDDGCAIALRVGCSCCFDGNEVTGADGNSTVDIVLSIPPILLWPCSILVCPVYSDSE